jgi:hypothetical protein
MLVNQPGYFWSTSITSKALVSEVLPLVLDQLVLAVKKYGQELHEDDIAWLTEHIGRFKKYVHPNSAEFGTISRSAKYKKLKCPLLIMQAVLTNLHTVVGESPRIANTTCCANYANRKEAMLAQLWNFLAITKDYDSMLLLLGNPFENSPPALSFPVTRVLFYINTILSGHHSRTAGVVVHLCWTGWAAQLFLRDQLTTLINFLCWWLH